MCYVPWEPELRNETRSALLGVEGEECSRGGLQGVGQPFSGSMYISQILRLMPQVYAPTPHLRAKLAAVARQGLAVDKPLHPVIPTP